MSNGTDAFNFAFRVGKPEALVGLYFEFMTSQRVNPDEFYEVRSAKITGCGCYDIRMYTYVPSKNIYKMDCLGFTLTRCFTCDLDDLSNPEIRILDEREVEEREKRFKVNRS